MQKTSVELMQKSAGYLLAASNARKRELNEKPNKQKTITIVKKTTTVIKTIKK